jgi:hypothetical protein
MVTATAQSTTMTNAPDNTQLVDILSALQNGVTALNNLVATISSLSTST